MPGQRANMSESPHRDDGELKSHIDGLLGKHVTLEDVALPSSSFRPERGSGLFQWAPYCRQHTITLLKQLLDELMPNATRRTNDDPRLHDQPVDGSKIGDIALGRRGLQRCSRTT